MITIEESRARAEIIVNACAGSIKDADPTQELKHHFDAVPMSATWRGVQ